MTVNTRATEATTTAEPLDILALYRTMVTARVTNDLLKTRKTQGKFPFYIGCAGHESMAAVVTALDENDWLSLYYRDLAAWLQRTGDIYGPLREAYSRTTGPMGAGRNMPSHYSSKRYRILPSFSEVGALAPFAGGVAFSLQRHKGKEIIAFTVGDGGVATKDLVKNYGSWLVNQGYLQEDDIARIRKEARAELEHAESQILREPEPTGDRVLHHVIQLPQWRENTPRGARRQSTMLSAINEGLVELAQRDPDFFVYGQDVGSPKGGVFGATAMLVTKFPERAISSPLNEQLIAGITAGAGMIEGKARCAEIQFVDYHQP